MPNLFKKLKGGKANSPAGATAVHVSPKDGTGPRKRSAVLTNTFSEAILDLDMGTREACSRLRCTPVEICLESPMRVEILSLDAKCTLKKAKDHYVQLLRVVEELNKDVADDDHTPEERFVLVYARQKSTFKSRGGSVFVLDHHEMCEVHAGHIKGRTFSIKASREVVTFHAATSEDMFRWVAELKAVRDWPPMEGHGSSRYHVRKVHSEGDDYFDMHLAFDRSTVGQEEICFVNPITCDIVLSEKVVNIAQVLYEPIKESLRLDVDDERSLSSTIILECPGHWCRNICTAICHEMKEVLGAELGSSPCPELGPCGMKYYPNIVPDYSQAKPFPQVAEETTDGCGQGEADEEVPMALPDVIPPTSSLGAVVSISVTDTVSQQQQPQSFGVLGNFMSLVHDLKSPNSPPSSSTDLSQSEVITYSVQPNRKSSSAAAAAAAAASSPTTTGGLQAGASLNDSKNVPEREQCYESVLAASLQNPPPVMGSGDPDSAEVETNQSPAVEGCPTDPDSAMPGDSSPAMAIVDGGDGSSSQVDTDDTTTSNVEVSNNVTGLRKPCRHRESMARLEEYTFGYPATPDQQPTLSDATTNQDAKRSGEDDAGATDAGGPAAPDDNDDNDDVDGNDNDNLTYDRGSELPNWLHGPSLYQRGKDLGADTSHILDNVPVLTSDREVASDLPQTNGAYQKPPKPVPKDAVQPSPSPFMSRNRLISCPQEAHGAAANDLSPDLRMRSNSNAATRPKSNRNYRVIMQDNSSLDDALRSILQSNSTHHQFGQNGDGLTVHSGHGSPESNDVDDDDYERDSLFINTGSATSPPIILVRDLESLHNDTFTDCDGQAENRTSRFTIRSQSTSDLSTMEDCYDVPRPSYSHLMRCPSPDSAQRQRAWSRENESTLQRSYSFSGRQHLRADGYCKVGPGGLQSANDGTPATQSSTDRKNNSKSSVEPVLQLRPSTAAGGAVLKPKAVTVTKSPTFLERLRIGKRLRSAQSEERTVTTPANDSNKVTAGLQIAAPAAPDMSPEPILSAFPSGTGKSNVIVRPAVKNRPLPRTPSELRMLELPHPGCHSGSVPASPAVPFDNRLPVLPKKGSESDTSADRPDLARHPRYKPGADEPAKDTRYEDIPDGFLKGFPNDHAAASGTQPAKADKMSSYEDIALRVDILEQEINHRYRAAVPTVDVSVSPPTVISTYARSTSRPSSALQIRKRVVTPDLANGTGLAVRKRVHTPDVARRSWNRGQYAAGSQSSPVDIESANNGAVARYPDAIGDSSPQGDSKAVEHGGMYSLPLSNRCMHNDCTCSSSQICLSTSHQTGLSPQSRYSPQPRSSPHLQLSPQDQSPRQLRPSPQPQPSPQLKDSYRQQWGRHSPQTRAMLSTPSNPDPSLVSVSPVDGRPYEYNVPGRPMRVHSMPGGDTSAEQGAHQARKVFHSIDVPESPEPDPCYQEFRFASDWMIHNISRTSSSLDLAGVAGGSQRSSANRSASELFLAPGPEGVVH